MQELLGISKRLADDEYKDQEFHVNVSLPCDSELSDTIRKIIKDVCKRPNKPDVKFTVEGECLGRSLKEVYNILTHWYNNTILPNGQRVAISWRIKDAINIARQVDTQLEQMRRREVQTQMSEIPPLDGQS